MTANIVTRNYQLIIDGLDCSQCLVQMTGGYSHYGSQPGLIKIDGSLTLQRATNWTEDLDDRSNGRWAKGKEIKITIADTTGTLRSAPIIGTVYIIESEYDGINTLQIKFGCKLTLLDANTPPKHDICFPLGDETSNTTIVTTLLEKIGITGGFIGSIPGSMFVPSSRFNNGSLIGLIGQICYSQGCIGYQGNDGIIRIKPINLSPSPHFIRTVGKHEVEYKRLTGVEKPCEKIICSGVKLETKKPNPSDNWHDWREEYSKAKYYLPNASGDIVALREYREEKVNRLTRTISQKHFIWQPKVRLLPRHVDAGLALWYELKEFVDKVYEPPTGEICGLDEGRLKYTQTLRYQPFGLALAEWVDNNEHGWTETDLIVAEKIVEDWQYSDGSIPSIDPATGLLSNQPILSYQKLMYWPLGAILPEDDHVLPSSLQLARKEMRSWRKIAEDDWEEYYEERESIALADPNVLDRLEESGRDLTTASKIALTIKKREPYRSNSGQSHPPSPNRFPADAEVKEILITGETQLSSIFGSEFRARERHYQVEAGLLTSEAQAQRIAEIEGAILWGRYKGQAFASPVFDPLFEISPLAACHWLEPSGKEQKFLMDGATLSFVQGRCVFASDAIWAGLVGVRSVETSTAEDPPIPDPQDPTEQAIAKPYNKAVSFCSGRAIRTGFDVQSFGSSEPVSFYSIRAINPLDLTSAIAIKVKAESVQTRGTLASVQPITVATYIEGVQTRGTLASVQPITVATYVESVQARGTLASVQPITVTANTKGVQARGTLASVQPITVNIQTEAIQNV
jgi:hypothetical protein